MADATRGIAPRLHRNPQEVRSVRTEIPMHDRTVPVSCHPHERNSPAASSGSPNYTGVRTGAATAKEGRGALRRAKESQPHRPASASAPQVEVRTRAVLPGGNCPEYQAAGPVPQPTNDVTGSRHFIGKARSPPINSLQSSIPKLSKRRRVFQHPTPNIVNRLLSRDTQSTQTHLALRFTGTNHPASLSGMLDSAVRRHAILRGTSE